MPTPRKAPSNRPLPELFTAFLNHLRTRKPSPHTRDAYRRDLAGVGARVAEAAGVPLAELRLRHLTKGVLREAFASWADDHAAASVVRAWSAWNGFFSHLVAEDLLEGNPMTAVGKPPRTRPPVKVIRGTDVTAKLLRAAATRDRSARRQWPERDVALVAVFAVTGIRLAEATGLTLRSFDGPPGERRLTVVGKGQKARAIPVYPALEALVDRYLASRAERFPDHDLEDPATPLFVHTRGGPITKDQVQYWIERTYVRAGIRAQVPPGALVHALRHTFATTALEGGADVLEVQELLGHESLNTTRRYLEATANQLRDAVRAHPSQLAVGIFATSGDG